MSVIVKGKNPRKPHTVRYWDNGRQRERSFATLAEAKAFRTDTDHAQRYCVRPVNPDDGRAPFGPEAEKFVARMPVSELSRGSYRSAYRTHIAPVLGGRSLADVAADRDAVAGLLTGRMSGLSIDRRRKVRQIITGTLDDAVKTGKLASHACDGIPLHEGQSGERTGFVFPEHDQVAAVAARVGIAVWLMRGCGLRINEALAVEKADFIHGGRTLRVTRQTTRDGRAAVPLKKRRSLSDYRDVPVPSYLRDMVRDLPDGPLCPGTPGRKYAAYATVRGKFARAARDAGIGDGFHPHSLRHAFASTLLGRGVPITDVAEWLGHKNVNTTYAIYRHMLPDAPTAAVAALDAEYAEWTRPRMPVAA